MIILMIIISRCEAGTRSREAEERLAGHCVLSLRCRSVAQVTNWRAPIVPRGPFGAPAPAAAAAAAGSVGVQVVFAFPSKCNYHYYR